ncbi:MAG: methyltransferase [Syntrophales bacterium]|nr:methyltransferase [Syntrophales bacterium]
MAANSAENDNILVNKITELALAFQGSRILFSAFELGLFNALGDVERSSGEVAMTLGTDPRATDRLLNALCSLGLLKKKMGLFSNTPLTLRFLVKGKPEYMTGLMHYVHLWDSWSALTEAVREGKSLLAGDINERGDEWLSSFIAAMHERARRHAPSVVAMIDISRVSRLLDVGGGSGAYAMAFVRAKDDLRATVFDLPNVIPLTQKYIVEEGLSDKVDTVVGDYYTDNLGSCFDLVFLSAIIHSNSPEQNIELIDKACRAVNPGGKLVIQDFIMDGDRTTPAFGTFFALNMLVATDSGDTYTETEVRMWMEGAGLSNIHRKDTEIGTSIVIGELSPGIH